MTVEGVGWVVLVSGQVFASVKKQDLGPDFIFFVPKLCIVYETWASPFQSKRWPFFGRLYVDLGLDLDKKRNIVGIASHWEQRLEQQHFS